jgi:hypothetical protein
MLKIHSGVPQLFLHCVCQPKNISLRGIRLILDIKLQEAEKKCSHSAIFNGVKWKNLCLKYILESGYYSCIVFVIRKIFHSGAFDSFSILNCKRWKRKVFIQPFSKKLSGKMCA